MKIFRPVILLFVLFQFDIGAALAQERGWMKSEGALPEVFTNSLRQNYELGIGKSISEDDKKWVKNSKEEFILESSFFLSTVLKSGYVLHNNEITRYLKTILDKVIKSDPLRDSVEIFVLKTSVSNAFATHQGVIFVTTGLLASLENEAQLAFILGHEFIHVKEKHSIGQHIEGELNIKESKRKQALLESYISHMSRYSQALELAADSGAYRYILDSDYQMEDAIGVFDILKYSYLPFLETEFDTTYFVSERFIIPSTFYLKEAIKIEFNPDEDSALSTHPSIEARIDAIYRMSDSLATDLDGKYIGDSTMFNRALQLSRDEVIRIQLANRSYVTAFYNSYSLHQNDPNDEYFIRCMIKALYGLAKYKNAGNYYAVTSDQQGAISKYFYFFEKLNKDALSVIVLNKMIELNISISDPFCKKLISNLCKEVQKYNKVTFDRLLFEPLPVNISSADPVLGDSLSEKQDVVDPDKIIIPNVANESHEERANNEGWGFMKEGGGSDEKKPDKDTYDRRFFRLAFIDQDSALIRAIFESAATIETDTTAHESEKTYKNAYEERRAERLEKKYIAKYGKPLGIKKVVYADPGYLFYNERKGLKILKSDDGIGDFLEFIRHAKKGTNLEVEILSTVQLDRSATAELENIGRMNSLLREIARHEEDHLKTHFYPLETDYTAGLIEQYGTEFVCYSGLLHYKYRSKSRALKIIGALFLTSYFSPFFIAWTLAPNYITYYYHVVIDIKTGELVDEQETTRKVKLGGASIESELRDKMGQIHRQKF